MKAGNKRIPKFQQIKKHIQEQINGKKLEPGQRLPSEAELAKIFDVSIITVRRALAELVNEEAIYRIQGKGTFVAYPSEPDIKNDIRKRLITFVLSHHDECYDGSFMQMIRGIQSYLKRKNFSLIIEYTGEDIEKERKIIKKHMDDGIGGIILFSGNPDENIEVIDEIRRRQIPFVLVDRYTSLLPVNYVGSDNFDGAYRAVEYLISQGHDNIGFIQYLPYISSERERLLGYKQAMINNAKEVNKELIISYNFEEEEQILKDILEREITALIVVNDFIATQLMDVCYRQDIKIPEQLSIIGFDDVENAKYQKVPLSTVKQYFEVMGKEAAKVLIRVMNSPELGAQRIVLPTKLIIRNSTGLVER